MKVFQGIRHGVTVDVNNRVHVGVSGPKDPLSIALKQRFTHDNPGYQTWKTFRMGKPPEKQIVTWKSEYRGQSISVPRGGFEDVLQMIRGLDRDPCVHDHTTSVPVSFRSELRDPLWAHQSEARRSFCRIDKRFVNGLWRAPQACLTGDTIVGVNRGGKSFQLRLDELVLKQNGDGVYPGVWDLSIPTQIRGRSGTGYIRLFDLEKAFETGVRLVKRYRLSNGASLSATDDHWVLVRERGEWNWREFGEVSIGTTLCVEGEESQKPHKPEVKSRYEVGCRGHRYAGRRSNATRGGDFYVAQHRLVVEAGLNGLSFDEYLEGLRSGKSDFFFLNPKMFDVHHLDEDRRNNTLDNLAVMTGVGHQLHHSKQDGWKHVTAGTVPAVVVGIDSLGEQPTYDLQIAAPNNFLANGVVVHNSGKTQTVVATALQLEQKTLIIVSTTSLFEQWAIRVRRELGFEPGIIQGKRRDIRPPITIGMAKTLSTCAADYAEAFGFVALDESQIAGSETIQNVMDVFTARYRLGVSADERRADRKEFLTYDVFGPVTYEISRESVERTGSVVDVEIQIIPTDFRADWYVALGADDPSDERQRLIAARDKVHHRARLLEQLTGDEARNWLAVHWALQTSRLEGNGGVPAQFVMLSDRREQCHQLDALLAARSIRSGLFVGGADYAQQFELTLAGMKNHSLLGAVGTYQAIGVGFEANRELSVGIAASPCVFNEKSRMQFNQYRGRFARSAPGKTRGVFCYLWDRHVYGMNPIRLLCRWNKSVKVWTPDGWVEGKRFLKDA